MSKPIPDYTESQIWTVAKSLKEHFRKEVVIRLNESEIRLNPHDRMANDTGPKLESW